MKNFTETLAEGLKKFALAGMGAFSFTVEKSKDLIDQLVARGEVTAAEGAAAYDELQRKLTAQVNAFTGKLRSDYENFTFEHMLEKCASLSPEQKVLLIERLTASEPPAADSAESTESISCEASEAEVSEAEVSEADE